MNTNNTKTHSELPTKARKAKKSRIKCVITILLSLCSIGCIYSYIDYLYGIRALDLITAYISREGEYVNRYKLQNGRYYTKNSERIYNLNSVVTSYYKKERIGTKNYTKLGTDSIGSNWLRRDIGPIPVGRKISSYEIYGKQWYEDGSVTQSIYEEVPQYQYYYNDYGILSWRTKYKKVQRFFTVPIYQQYHFSRCFSTFDIDEYVPLFSNEEKVYNKLLDNITIQLKNTYSLTYEEGTIGDYRAIIYDTQDEIPMRRVIFCANKRMYILETKSTHDLSKLSYNYCSNLHLKAYDIKKEWYIYVITPFGGLVLSSLFISLLHFGRRKTINTNAKKMATISFVMLIICMIFLYLTINYEFDIYPAEFSGISSALTISIFINSLTISWLFQKANGPYSTDYAVPQWVKKIIYDKFRKERSRRLYLTFIIYPVIFLISTPFFILGFVYAIIATIITKFIMLFCQWIRWINASDTTK